MMYRADTTNTMLHSAAMKRAYTPASILLLLLLIGLTVTGCSPGAGGPEVEEAELQDVLEQYLPLVGRAYGERNVKLLEGIAVPKEMARIDKRIQELEELGQIYEPKFKQVTVEKVSTWNYSNAFVTTLEVWDVSAFTMGSRLLVNQSLDQRSRVKYQMKRKGDSWVVLYRELDQTFDS